MGCGAVQLPSRSRMPALVLLLTRALLLDSPGLFQAFVTCYQCVRDSQPRLKAAWRQWPRSTAACCANHDWNRPAQGSSGDSTATGGTRSRVMLSMESSASQHRHVVCRAVVKLRAGAVQGIFNDEAFAKIKQGARIVNVARGGVIDDDALARAIDAKQVAQVWHSRGLLTLAGQASLPHSDSL